MITLQSTQQETLSPDSLAASEQARKKTLQHGEHLFDPAVYQRLQGLIQPQRAEHLSLIEYVSLSAASAITSHDTVYFQPHNGLHPAIAEIMAPLVEQLRDGNGRFTGFALKTDNPHLQNTPYKEVLYEYGIADKEGKHINGINDVGGNECVSSLLMERLKQGDLILDAETQILRVAQGDEQPTAIGVLIPQLLAITHDKSKAYFHDDGHPNEVTHQHTELLPDVAAWMEAAGMQPGQTIIGLSW